MFACLTSNILPPAVRDDEGRDMGALREPEGSECDHNQLPERVCAGIPPGPPEQ